jgi:hypothetical protein
LLPSNAAPPSNVIAYHPDESLDYVLAWTAPELRAGLIKGYEIQYRNPNMDTEWRTIRDLSPSNTTVVNLKKKDYQGRLVNFIPQDQFRVRTILTTGAKSIYAATPIYDSIVDVPAPDVYWSQADGGVFMVVPYSVLPLRVQVRASFNDAPGIVLINPEADPPSSLFGNSVSAIFVNVPGLTPSSAPSLQIDARWVRPDGSGAGDWGRSKPRNAP